MIVSSKEIISKLINTLEKFNKYKKKLENFRDAINGKKEIDAIKAIRTELLFHFTSFKNAKSIITSKKIKLNNNKYISLSELSLFEVGSLVKKRKYGFGFLKDEVIKKYPIVSPLFFNEKSEKDPKVKKMKGSKKYNDIIVEKSKKGQDSINFSIFREIRSLESLELKDCICFLRNDEEDLSNKEFKILSELGIIRFPYTSYWLKYFIDEQKWCFRKNGHEIEFSDTKSVSWNYEKEISLLQLIKKLKEYKDC